MNSTFTDHINILNQGRVKHLAILLIDCIFIKFCNQTCIRVCRNSQIKGGGKIAEFTNIKKAVNNDIYMIS